MEPIDPRRKCSTISCYVALGTGAIASWIAKRGRAKCDSTNGLTYCSGGRIKLWARGGTTIGDVHFGPSKPTGRLVDHEKKHVRQWKYFGAYFPLLHFGAEAAGTYLWYTNPYLKKKVKQPSCLNIFEIAAGLSGNYKC